MSAERAGEKKKGYFYCEVCRKKVEYADAEKEEFAHCGRKMTPLEEAYMDSPSPTGA